MMIPKRIGVLGGTFDPIHNGHLYLAKKVMRRFCLDKIIFIPTYLTPHKTGRKITPTQHRYNMVRLALSGIKNFEVSDIEIKRKGKSYSVDTLRQLRKRFGPKTEIFFITGSDSLKDLDKWKGLDEILKLCRFVVVERPGFDIDSPMQGFIIVNINAKNIAASAIRKSLKNGRSITRLVPAKVKAYIKSHGLYFG